MIFTKIVLIAKEDNETIPNILYLLMFLLLIVKEAVTVVSQMQPRLSLKVIHVQNSVRLQEKIQMFFMEVIDEGLSFANMYRFYHRLFQFFPQKIISAVTVITKTSLRSLHCDFLKK